MKADWRVLAENFRSLESLCVKRGGLTFAVQSNGFLSVCSVIWLSRSVWGGKTKSSNLFRPTIFVSIVYPDVVLMVSDSAWNRDFCGFESHRLDHFVCKQIVPSDSLVDWWPLTEL